MNSLPDFSEILAAWNLPGPLILTPLDGGTNSLVYRVETANEQKYVLRLILNHADLGRINFETAIVNQLQTQPLPFVVPAPLPTRTGQYLATIGGQLANLWPLVPGRNPDTVTPALAFQAGLSLGALTQAMAQLDLPQTHDYTLPPPYGDLDKAHPFVTDPVKAIEELPVEPETKRILVGMVEEMRREVPPFYEILPQQLIHSDFNRYNVLAEEDLLTGVLDFEYATWDVRVMDLAVALSAWSLPLIESGQEWTVIEAFGKGYSQNSPLAPIEKEALPVLFKLRFVTVLLHFIGRYRQGLSGPDDYERWIGYSLKIEKWLAANQARLEKEIQGW